jgi:hypothetical protein
VGWPKLTRNLNFIGSYQIWCTSSHEGDKYHLDYEIQSPILSSNQEINGCCKLPKWKNKYKNLIANGTGGALPSISWKARANGTGGALEG